jgi:hypothetical protein
MLATEQLSPTHLYCLSKLASSSSNLASRSATCSKVDAFNCIQLKAGASAISWPKHSCPSPHFHQDMAQGCCHPPPSAAPAPLHIKLPCLLPAAGSPRPARIGSTTQSYFWARRFAPSHGKRTSFARSITIPFCHTQEPKMSLRPIWGQKRY